MRRRWQDMIVLLRRSMYIWRMLWLLLLLLLLQELPHHNRELVVFSRQAIYSPIVFEINFRDLPFHLGGHVQDAFLQLDNLRFEIVHVVLGLLIRLGGTLDAMQEFRFVLLELFVVETNVGRCLWVDVVGQDGIRPKLAKAIKVQLAGKTRKVAMLEVQRKDSARKFFHVLHDKVISRRRPRCNVWIASIDHMVGFYFKEKKEETKLKVVSKRSRKQNDGRG